MNRVVDKSRIYGRSAVVTRGFIKISAF